MGKHNNLVYVGHIRDSILAVEEFVGRGGKELFEKDKAIQNAIIKELEIIGEACRNISEEYKKTHTAIPWSEVIGARDKLVHDYMGVDLERVWRMATQDIPELKKQIEEILSVEG